MSQPTPYSRQFSFTNDQTSNPSTKTPGNQLDLEFNSVLITLSQTLSNLALIQRDDGHLANGSVGVDQLDPGLVTGVSPATLWTTATSYSVGNTVFNGFLLYRCLIAHTSGVFATDLAAVKWLKIADFTASGGVASLGGASGVLTLGSNLSMVGQALTWTAPGGTTVNSIGNQSGAITINGGNMSSGVLPVARYDVAQTLSTSNQQQLVTNQGLATAFRGHLAGLTLSAAGGTATFGIAIGAANDSTNTDVMNLASAYTKTTGAWVVGSGNGAIDTGAVANTTWYHVHLIKRPDTGVVDVLFSLSATAPTLPTNYTLFRRIGAMKTNGSAQWGAFTQFGDNFIWTVPVSDLSAGNPAPGLTITLSVPTGVIIEANINADFSSSVTNDTLLLHPLVQGILVSNTPLGNFTRVTSSAGGSDSGQLLIQTNTSAQIRAVSAGAGTGGLYVVTNGWRDRRGKDS